MSDLSNDDTPKPNDPFRRQVPFLELLSIRRVNCHDGKANVKMTVGEKHLRTLGILHGGVVTSLLDTAMGMAAGTYCPDGHYVVTVQLNANFIRPAWDGETLLATGEIRHSGRQTAVALGEIRADDDVLVATGTGTFMYLPIPDGGSGQLERRND